ncbi:MAG: PQQ-dependent sugar dehydrogenase [Dongiaceae bacterium]
MAAVTWQRLRLRWLAATLPLLVASRTVAADTTEFDTEKVRIRVVTVAEGLDHPWGLAFLPDGALLVTERSGQLRLLQLGKPAATIAGVPEVRADGQGGLLDVALDPGFVDNRLVYLSFSEPGEGGAGTAVARGRLGDGRLDDVEVIFRQRPKAGSDNHFGSRLVFAPDGTLFVTTGDRYRLREEAQNPANHVGKVVRINPDGSVPADNPFVGRADAAPEVWSLGHRNMQGATLDPATGALWTVEHGARGGDEINRPEAGKNYGWPVITYGVDYSGAKIGEGTAKPGLEQPVYYWDPSIAPSGLAFYTADRFPGWQGNLFVGSLKFGLLVRLEMDGGRPVHEERMLEDIDERIRDVRQGPDGLLYLLTDSSDGRVLRLEPAF